MSSKTYFDRDWYLDAYPDVADAGIDPQEHFEKHGRKEGRLPCSLPAIALEKELWSNAFSPTKQLEQLQKQAVSKNTNAAYAYKVLCAFFLFSSEYEKAWKYAKKILTNLNLAKRLFYEEELFLLIFSSAFRIGNFDIAEKLVGRRDWHESVSKRLAASMLTIGNCKQVILNNVFSNASLSTINLEGKGDNVFDQLDTSPRFYPDFSPMKWFFRKKLVSIIIPAFNCEKTIETAVRSILNQTWRNTEIIIVNDSSTDNTLNVANSLRDENPKVHVITNDQNFGAYKTRNIGVEAASGDFVTVIDADDWAHPQKIEKQLFPLFLNSSLIATLSHWVRCDNDLNFVSMRNYNGWVHRNVSSLLLRKDSVTMLGGWDEVKVNADTEFYERCLAKFGLSAIKEIMPGIPLSFGRVHTSSLTQNTETHLVTQYGGIRKQYMDFARVWHKNSSNLKLLSEPKLRTFPAPPSMLLGLSEPSLISKNKAGFDKWSKALDENWYGQIYTDVSSMGFGLHDHFWDRGEKEGRYPSPLFVPQAYAYKFHLRGTVSPTWHALNNKDWDFSAPVSILGFAKCQGSIHVALFGHFVSEKIFGAERSLVDMAKAMNQSEIEVTLFLPSCSNVSYIEELRQFVSKIVFLPLPWANGRRQPIEPIAQYLESDFLSFSYDCVYVNTLTLIEPLSAAKKVGIPSVMHVRELVAFDQDLAKLLQESPQLTHERVISSCDYFIANSYETAHWLREPERTSVIYNCVDTPSSQVPMPSGPLKVCMLSSNVKKKGVMDFFEVASLCKESRNIQFTIYGPITNEVIMAAQRYHNANVIIGGYVENSKKAMVEHHIVLALSHFKESFGRTVAEAMSLGRVVVGYKWGAVGELVDNQFGILVEYKSTTKIAEAVLKLNNKPELLASIGDSAAQRAKELFSRDTFDNKLVEQVIKISKKSANIKSF
ncbi:MAG: hypothetical protein Altm2KO_20320 [Alteromonas macleodii]|jgi:glycosyltransferase involved in cell wall biosynthesis|uniref:glycosyltransferase n=1 Tax=Alteromonas TaxID=226 RepID=UPI00079A9EBA|nr:glycosyltransferase [Alteromonas macleodii]KXJ60223.1 MAG: glycosyl transferase family 2 [Alteromonas sp. Nap_26]MDM7962175.1 glycosyltransferase [Alteromonas macleodii]MDM8170902.1 glycosyltransferase [Alteromonas macleodii]CAI3967600.1 glycosyl transferase family 4 [Alteromonas macleodii]VTP57475.1 glycosyl transferase family 4 [Alteromonas macleodii]|tara:strand:+ start:317 stop:3133 length:2817 start_codon:yes stop_codon:yes gene_type:complete